MFVLAIFLPAFLIFLVQPMVGKRILPWFGGAPAVWAVCLAFYQTSLFFGYAYAHLLIRFVPPTLQVFVHATLIVIAVVARPILPDSTWATGHHENPIPSILAMLSIHVALPFMALASSGPLVQSWFSTRFPNRSPYPLYSVSNFGSLLALGAFPFLIEPHFGLEQTGHVWSWGFIGAMLLVVAAAVLARGTSPGLPSPTAAPKPLPTGAGHVALWILLPAVAVLMLNALTNRLCLDVASAPFLWILPLGTYLATFIISFSSESLYRRSPYFGLVFIVLAISCFQNVALRIEQDRPTLDMGVLFGSMPVGVASLCLLLFALCSILHGELYRLRPRPEKLTAFYLCISGGGALGGLFVGVAAPSLFDGYMEYAIGLVLALGLGAFCAARESGGAQSSWRQTSGPLKAIACIGIVLVGAEVYQVIRPAPGQTHQERNFFGVLRVVESTFETRTRRQLLHGTTVHGTQFLAPPELNQQPTSYYGRISPLGVLFTMLPPNRAARIGAVGLGAGTIAAYGREGDLIRFYEIDPAVIRIAQNEEHFTFLSNSKAQIEIVQGDARLLLEMEQRNGEDQNFDILVIDAFSSDAIPIHLLTSEAFDAYVKSLSPNGVIAVHVSNRHFELMPLVSRSGEAAGLDHLMAANQRIPHLTTAPSKWVLLTQSPRRSARIRRASLKLLRQFALASNLLGFGINTSEALSDVPLWTDDYSDLFGVLKLRGFEAQNGEEGVMTDEVHD